MWFKNAFVFRLTRADFFSQLQLALLLNQTKFRECGATESETFGWDSALPGTTNLVHSVDNNNYQLIRACKSTKTLPTDFLNREIAKQTKVIECDQSRKVTKKEKEQIKEDLLFEHLPNAFPNYKHTDVYFDNINQLLIVNTATRGAAEDVLALLRKCIGTLPVTAYFTVPLQDCLNHWVDGQRDIEPGFVLGGNVQFSSSGDAPAQAKFTNEEDIKAKAISNFIINEDRDVNYLSLEFDEAFYFTLDARGFLKGIKPFDVLAEQNEDIDSDDDLARIDADFFLFAREMGRLFCAFKDMKVTDETQREVFDVSTISYPTLEEMAGEALEGFTVTVSAPEEPVEESDEDDSLLNEAKAFVIEQRRVSTSAVQRKFRIGYNRSARIVEQLESQGVVSEPGHNGVREVLAVALEEV
jgi:recombination associated protein RdgC